ncbi:site-specific integrase [Bacillus thermotolerans]|uniref:site-specific integrase n=1 Tax=Bacillus thermotolerans TaxID=1221996 RepID=UPI0012EE6FEA|nr:site-specific integrase [Bacillus thermotolerans]
MMAVQPIREKDKIEQMKTVLMHSSYRDYFLFCFGINTGLRISDILPMKVKDIKGKTHIILKETKTRKSKRLKLAPVAQRLVEDYVEGLHDEDYLFPSKKGGKPISRVQAYRVLNAAAEKVGIGEIGTHTLRKTFGFHFYQQYKDVVLLQEIFNHSAPSVTLRYIGINDDIMDKAIDGFGL